MQEDRLKVMRVLGIGLGKLKATAHEEFNELVEYVIKCEATLNHLRQISTETGEEYTVPGSVIADTIDYLADLAGDRDITLLDLVKEMREGLEKATQEVEKVREVFDVPESEDMEVFLEDYKIESEEELRWVQEKILKNVRSQIGKKLKKKMYYIKELKTILSETFQDAILNLK